MRTYVRRNLGDSGKSRIYQTARRRALEALRRNHPQEYEHLFNAKIEQLRQAPR